MLRIIRKEIAVVIPAVEEKKETSWSFEDGSIFTQCKSQIVQEIEEVMDIVGINRLDLAHRLNIQPSAVTQSLDVKKGLQLTTLIRIADALDCDLEVNLIRRGPFTGMPSDYKGLDAH